MADHPRPMIDSDLQNRIENDFRFHPADEARGEQHAKVREVLRDAAVDIVRLVPSGRERSLALTKLEEAMMWANAGIARQS
jgi:hypothetical protein